jgi:hypothetical protein
MNELANKLDSFKSFIFGEGTENETYESLQKKRAMAARMGGAIPNPQSFGDGLSALGNAIAYRRMNNQVDRGEAAGKEEANNIFQSLIGGQQPHMQGAFPSGGDHMATFDAQRQGSTDKGKGADIRQGLISRGLPEHVADGFIMNFQDESGLDPSIQEENPLVAGSRGGRGLYQLTGPRRVEFEKQYGGNYSVDNQLDFLMQELGGSESAAAQRIMQTSDAGGAGAAIAQHFLRPSKEHLDRRVAKYTGGQQPMPQPQGGGVNPALIQALDNPYLGAGQKNALQMMLRKQIEGNQPVDPMKAIQFEKAQLELEQMRNPKAPERKTIQGADGFTYYVDDGSRVLPNVEGPTEKPTTSQSDYNFYATQEQAAGREPLSFNEYELQNKKAGASNVTTNNNISTKGQEAADKQLGSDFVAWTGGGGADSAKQIAQLESVAAQLKDGGNYTGLDVGGLPDTANILLGRGDAVDMRERVEEVVQRNLRVILGAQFTEKEGERLIKRAYNPNLTEEQNGERLQALIQQMKLAHEAKTSQAQYFQQNQTLLGWEGKAPSIEDFGNFGNDTPKAPQASGGRGAPATKRLKYNPETGKLE